MKQSILATYRHLHLFLYHLAKTVSRETLFNTPSSYIRLVLSTLHCHAYLFRVKHSILATYRHLHLRLYHLVETVSAWSMHIRQNETIITAIRPGISRPSESDRPYWTVCYNGGLWTTPLFNLKHCSIPRLPFI